MQGFEPKKSQMPSQAVAKQSGAIAAKSQRAGDVGQLEALIGASSRMKKLGGMAAMLNTGPAQAAQRKLNEMIVNSPSMTARKVTDEAILQAKSAWPASARLRQPGQLPSTVPTRSATGAQARQTGGKPAHVIDGAVLQRMVDVRLGKDNLVKAKLSTKRPRGGAGNGSQGDHITPFGVLQSQLANAVAEQTLTNAWDALSGTYFHYKELPGWDTTPQWILGYDHQVLAQLLTQGDIKALQATITLMLTIRNSLDLTSIKGGTKGHGEGTWLGGLNDLERKLQLNKTLPNTITKAQVIFNMVELFEHGRYQAMTSKRRKGQVVEQHSLTIVDAFPLLSAHFRVTSDDVESEF